MDYFIGILYIFYILFIGFLILEFFFKDDFTYLIKVGLSFAVGSCYLLIIALTLFFFHIPWNTILIFIIFSMPLFSLFRLSNINFKPCLKIKKVDLLLLLLVLSVMGFSVFESFLRPLLAWDGIASWMMGGKGIFLNRTITPSFYYLMNFDFPPGIHIIIGFLNVIIGNFSERASMLIFNTYYISLIVLFFAILKKNATIKFSLIFTFLLVSTQNVVRHGGMFDIGYVDLPLSYYILVFIVFLERSIKIQSKLSLLFLGISIGLISLIKDEGATFSIASFFVFAFFYFKKLRFKKLIMFLPGVLMLVFWYTYKTIFLSPSQFSIHNGIHFESSLQILFHILLELINIQRWNLGWVFIILSLLLLSKPLLVRMILLICLLQFIAVFGAYLLTPDNPVVHTIGSIDRILLQVYPILLYSAALAIKNITLKNKKIFL